MEKDFERKTAILALELQGYNIDIAVLSKPILLVKINLLSMMQTTLSSGLINLKKRGVRPVWV